MIRQAKHMDFQPSAIEVFELTDPQEIEQARLQQDQADRNSKWLQQHIAEVYVPANRGKIVYIAGEEAFIGEDGDEVVARAKAAHPNDRGYFTRYIPRQKMTWIYANRPAHLEPAFLHGFSPRDD